MAKKISAFTAVGADISVPMTGYFNVAVWGTFVGTIQLERTFDPATQDDTANWIPCSLSPDGSVAAYTGPASVVGFEPEAGVRYRLRCTAFTSGPINGRISQS